MARKVSTGISNLDSIIEGGFREGSLILLAGAPGTGKTIFGMKFLHHGAVHNGEPGIFVSFAEGKETLIENTISHMRYDRTDFEQIEILDFVSVKEKGLESVMEIIISNIDTREAKRLVVDSFTAMTNGLKEVIDARILAHVLGRLVKQTGCTTVLIIETPIGTDKIGMGVEEFVADGIIALSRKVINGRIIREMDILKLRGTKIKSPMHLFTLENGFQVLPKFTFRMPTHKKKIKPIPDTKTHFSSGSEDLDKFLDGGWKRRSVNLIEVAPRIDTKALLSLIFTTGINFVMHGNGFLNFDPLVFNANTVKEYFEPLVGGERLNNSVRCLEVAKYPHEETKFTLYLKGEKLNEDGELVIESLKDVNLLERPICSFASLDATANYYKEDNAIRTILTSGVERVRKTNGLLILSALSSSEEISAISNIAESHLKLEEIYGTVVLYGVKPETGYHAVWIDLSKGYPELKLTPIS